MKRSEMKKLLKDVMDANGYGFADVTSSEEMASILLYEIEQAGMQPPNITLAELIPGSVVKTDPGQSQHYYACWEPEDEA